MADLDLERATVNALETFGLAQLDSLETCNTVIDGDTLDLLDTTEFPNAKAWQAFSDALEEWKKGSEGGEFWSLISQSWGGETGTGHKALLALLQLAMRSKEKGEEPWLAARTYVWLMDMPGASAYGVYNSTMFRSILGLIKSWLEGACGTGPSAGIESGSTAAASSSQSSSSRGRGRRKAPSRRGRSTQESDDEEDDDDDPDSEDDAAPKSSRSRTRGGGNNKGKRGGAAATSVTSGFESLLHALEKSLTSGSLAPSLRAHDDVQGELTELILGTYTMAPASGALADATCSVLMALVSLAGGGGGNPIVLRALMPLLTMKPNRNGLPTDARTRTSAHQKAVQMLYTLIKEGEERKRRDAEKPSATDDDPDAMEVDETPQPDEEEKKEEADEGDEEDSEEEEVEVEVGRKGRGKGKKGAAAAKKGSKKTKGKGKKVEEEDEKEEQEEDGEEEEAAKKAATATASAVTKKPPYQTNPPKNLHTTILAVLQHMCSDAPDRADVRSRLVDSVLGLLEALQKVAPDLGPRFLKFLAKLLRSAKVSHRAFGVEIAASFVNAPWAWPASAMASTTPPPAASEEGTEHVKTAAATTPSVWDSLVGLVESFASRVLDKAPTVRARAMVCLSEMLISVREGAAPPGLHEALLELAFPSVAMEEGQDLVSLVRTRCQDDKAVVRKAALQALEILFTTAAQSKGMKIADQDVKLFAQRCNDVSVLTRKQAMASLSSLLLADPANHALQETWVRSVLPLVADPEQSILNRLVDLLHEVILDRILLWHRYRTQSPQAASTSTRGRRGGGAVADAETDEDRAAAHSKAIAEAATVWELLSIVASRDLNKCLQNAINLVLTASGAQAASPRKLKDLMEALQSAALASIEQTTTTTALPTAEEGEDPTALRRGAWALLEAILASDRSGSNGSSSTAATNSVMPSDPAFVVTCWRKAFEGLGADEALEDDARKILRVLARIAPDVPADMGMELAEDLLGCVAGLDPRISPENCGASLDTIAALCLAKAPSPEEGAGIIRNAAAQVLEACESVLHTYVVDANKEEVDSEELISQLERATFLVGAVAILGFTPNEEEIKTTTTTRPSTASKGRGKKAAATAAASTSTGGGPLIRVPVPPSTISLLRVLLLPEIQPLATEDDEAPANTTPVKVPEQVRAHAFLALGKVCLRDKALAKENVNVFVRELSVSSSAAIKSNALLILGDLCVRYTSLVERHVPAMARCLQDESGLIRRHAMSLISQLLLQDYLKWRGLLLHRYLAILVDKDPRVAEIAEHMIFQPLLRKCPSLFVNHFVEALVVLNGCVDHDSYKAALSQGAESGTAVTMDGVDLEGDGPVAKKRMHIYRSMLQHMSDEQRIQVTAKLTQDILGAATDEDGETGGIKIQSHHRGRSAPTQRREAILRKLKHDENLVRDALAVLRCPDIKVASGSRNEGANQDEDTEALTMEEGTSNADAAAAAKGRLLSKVSRKHLLEHVVPELVSLKACLERAHSPLLKELMEYFIELMKANKGEVKDALNSNPTLFHEIEYDLQQFEKEQKAQVEARAAMPPPSLPSSTSSSSRLSKSPGHALVHPRQSSIGGSSAAAQATAAAAARRRSSIVGASSLPLNGRTPLTALYTTGKKKTPILTAVSAPRLRRSSVGASLSRTPAEAIKAALNPDGSSTEKGMTSPPQAFTPVPLRSEGEGRANRHNKAGKKGEGASTSADKQAEQEALKVSLPTQGVKAWKVRVTQSPLDEESVKENRAAIEMET